jgi:hypothetical protein
MSFDLGVQAHRVPLELLTDWPRALSEHGLQVIFHPAFDLMQWAGGWVPATLRPTRDAFPAAARYGSNRVVCGFELDIAIPRTPAAREGREARRYFAFRTAAGRTVADLRLQCFAAATLAILSEGLVEDPQQGASFRGERAIENARREADEYEAKWATPDQWRLRSVADHEEWPG